MPTGDLPLEQAVAAALLHSPELVGFAIGVRQAEAAALQAGLRPNPGLEMEMEEFAGTGDLAGTDAAEVTVAVGQLIELGGKRSKRRRLGDLDAQLAGWDYEEARIGVIVAVAEAFTNVLAAQELLRLAEEGLALAEAMRDAVTDRAAAGKVSPVEATRAGVELASVRIRLDRAGRELDTARHELAATWGATNPAFDHAVGVLDPIPALPAYEALLPLLSQNPELARWGTELDQRQAALDVEEAGAIPDLEVAVGVSHFNEIDEQAAVVGVAIPLPFFDRNQGNIAAASLAVRRAREDVRAKRTELTAALRAVYQELSAAQHEGATLDRDVVPAAELAFEATRRAFGEGKSDYLNVLDAQRTLLGAREQHVNVLAAQARAAARLEGLIGQPLATLKDTDRVEKETDDAE